MCHYAKVLKIMLLAFNGRLIPKDDKCGKLR